LSPVSVYSRLSRCGEISGGSELHCSNTAAPQTFFLACRNPFKRSTERTCLENTTDVQQLRSVFDGEKFVVSTRNCLVTVWSLTYLTERLGTFAKRRSRNRHQGALALLQKDYNHKQQSQRHEKVAGMTHHSFRVVGCLLA